MEDRPLVVASHILTRVTMDGAQQPLLPKPKPSAEHSPASSARFVYVGDPERSHRRSNPAPNAITTSKYTLLTFIPRNLYEQFRRVAYSYFFLLACLNQIPQLNTVSSPTAFIPLGVVLLLSALKDGYEDFHRHKSDSHQNNLRFAHVFDPRSRSFLSTKWKDVRVGDIVRLSRDDTLPCDLVLLSSSDPSGSAYIQTMNLDGESNLKTRYALHQFAGLPPESWASPHPALIKCEPPNMNLHGFQASIEMGDGREISLGPSNVALRGCEVRNTEWVLGAAVYAGMETKVMLNGSCAPSKRSRLERQMNRDMLILAASMLAMCCLIAALTAAWLIRNRASLDTMPYYRREDYSGGAPRYYEYDGLVPEVVFTFFRSVFSFQNLIPIALYFSMEMVRVTQAIMMSGDASMCDEATGCKLQCRALNINEDLGQVKYVFSDKTGTLTENKMVFRCASVLGVDYSHGEPAPLPAADVRALRPKTAVDADPELVRLLASGDDARSFFLALALCNTIVPQVTEITSDPDVKSVEYQGESPDEQALVYAAAAYGFVLVERTSGHVAIDALGERLRFEILGIHEFDSDRKRMSVIVGCPDKSIKIFVKGADSSVFSVINRSANVDIVHSTQKHLSSYSSMGLRTLVIGLRELTSTQFEEWLLAYERASTALSGRSESLKAVAVEVERDVDILGASGIEDKLQQGVPEAIEALRQAGIVVWVLTGDKQETAIATGYSCKLLTDDMTRIVINSHSEEAARKSIGDAIAISRRRNTEEGGKGAGAPIALIIDGPSLVHILKTELEEELFEVAVGCNAVLCCRVAPLQKAGIVSLIKERTSDLTLSIGDGANDVSMIQMADVGIGISGQEGRQAVMASDFAIGQFRFLVPLLLVHGHWNYHRMSYMVLYNIYRNAVLIFVCYCYLFYSEFSLTNRINELNSLFFGILYTALPNVYAGIYDEDLSRETLLKYPQMYGVGQREESYSSKLFVLMMTDCIWQSLALFFVPFFAYEHSSLDSSSLGCIWLFGTVLLVNLHLAMDIIRWNKKLHAVIWGSTILCFFGTLAIDQSPATPDYRAFSHLISTAGFWLMMLCTVVIAFLPRFVCKVFRDYMWPDDIRIGREMERLEEAAADTEDVTTKLI